MLFYKFSTKLVKAMTFLNILIQVMFTERIIRHFFEYFRLSTINLSYVTLSEDTLRVEIIQNSFQN